MAERFIFRYSDVRNREKNIMSLILGPIHHWLFGKILVAEERAFALAEALAAAGVGDDLIPLRERYGERLAGKELATLVGENPIHQFLQGLITKVQLFEASLVEAHADRVELLYETARRHGEETGRRLAEGKRRTAEEIARLLNDTQLEGMPCDPGATFTPFPDGAGFDYTHSACNHIGNWSYTGVDIPTMCRLYNRWIEGFVEGLGGGFRLEETIADGAARCVARVTADD